MTRSPKPCSDGSTRDPSTARRTSSGDDTATSEASCLGESTQTTTCRSDISNEQVARLKNVLEMAARVGNDAVSAYGTESQELMAVEEMGELLTAIAQSNRGRINDGQVVDESADVIITALQIGMIFGGGPDALIEAIARKSRRLSERISAHRAVHGGS